MNRHIRAAVTIIATLSAACGDAASCPAGTADMGGRCIPADAAVPMDGDLVDADPEPASDGGSEDGSDGDASIDACTPTTWYADGDADGHGDSESARESCAAPAGYVELSDDCDDAEGATHPAAAERCDLADNDCDGTVDEEVLTTFYRDADGDGYGDAGTSTSACAAPSGYVPDGTDCSDTCATCRPGGTEVCDGKDNDCDGTTDEGVLSTFHADADSDGYGDPSSSVTGCSAPAGHVADSTDCNDDCSTCHPSGTESCDGLDNDCDAATDEGAIGTLWYHDCDGDEYAAPGAGSTRACAEPAPATGCSGGWSTRAPTSTTSQDCRDDNALVYPGQTSWFNTPIAGTTSYDYDCDGAQEPRYTTTHKTSCPSSCSLVSCGWVGSLVPVCGSDGGSNDLRCCVPDLIGGGGCTDNVSSSYRQECR